MRRTAFRCEAGFGSTGFSLCGFPWPERKPKSHRLKPVLHHVVVRIDSTPIRVSHNNFYNAVGYLGPMTRLLDSYFSSTPLAGLPINLSYFSISDGEQYISMTSVWGSCNFIGNLFMAIQGFVYILGSSIVTVSSKWSWSARWNCSSTRIASLTGRPVISSQTRSSGIIPTVWATSVVSSTHLPTEYP